MENICELFTANILMKIITYIDLGIFISYNVFLILINKFTNTDNNLNCK